MPVIEAQYLSIMVPHDHRHISQKSVFKGCDVGERETHRVDLLAGGLADTVRAVIGMTSVRARLPLGAPA